MEELTKNRSSSSSSSVQALLARGRALHEELSAWGGAGTGRLQKLVRAELSFLNRLAALPVVPPASSYPALRSSNLDHLEDVFEILKHPLVDGVSAVMQNFGVRGVDNSNASERRDPTSKETAHVDIACMLDGKPAWLILSSGNPRFIRWLDTSKNVKGLKTRAILLLLAAYADAVKQPKSIFLCFRGKVPEDVDNGLRGEFRGIHVPSVGNEQPLSSSSSRDVSSLHPDLSERSLQECTFSEVEDGEWLDVEMNKDASRWHRAWETYEIFVDNFKAGRGIEVHAGLHIEEGHDVNEIVESKDEHTEEHDSAVCSSSSLSRAASDEQTGLVTSVLAALDQPQEQPTARDGQKLVNLDTTALVALVSEVSNGGAASLLALPEGDMERRFPSMSAFILEQSLSELEKPLAPEIEEVLTCRKPIVSQYVYNEFSSIVSQIGGAKEIDRATKLLRRIRVVPDTPSNRVMSLPSSGRIRRRHKIVFGTGDFFNAPTLTANMAFVRAAREKGMPIAILEHRPRALTGD